MPIIIDANRASDFKKPMSAHAPEILVRVRQKRMTVTVGGRLLGELSKTTLRDLLAEWARAGRLKRCDNDLVERETARFENKGIRSDDPHVLALAYISGCRLLYTDDQCLIKDFKDVSCISPKGKVIKTATQPRTAATLFERMGA